MRDHKSDEADKPDVRHGSRGKSRGYQHREGTKSRYADPHRSRHIVAEGEEIQPGREEKSKRQKERNN